MEPRNNGNSPPDEGKEVTERVPNDNDDSHAARISSMATVADTDNHSGACLQPPTGTA